MNYERYAMNHSLWKQYPGGI